MFQAVLCLARILVKNNPSVYKLGTCFTYNNILNLCWSWEGELKHVRVKTREEEGRTLYTFGNEVWYPTITELVRYFRTHRLYIADVHRHLYLDKPVCKPFERINAEQVSGTPVVILAWWYIIISLVVVVLVNTHLVIVRGLVVSPPCHQVSFPRLTDQTTTTISDFLIFWHLLDQK